MTLATLARSAPLLTSEPDSESLYEIVDGERREIPHMGAWAGTIASILVYYLNAFAVPKKLGLAIVEVLFRFAPDLPARRPDLAFVASGRWPVKEPLTMDPPEWDVVPNLAVEVVSPSNSAQEIIDKIHEYFKVGVQLVWIIYPSQRCVYVYVSPANDRILLEKDQLDGGQVLPGFRLSIAELFAPADKP